METTNSSTGNSGTGVRDELRSDARTLSESTTNRLHSEVDARKGQVANQVKSISSALSQTRAQLQTDGPDWLRTSLDSAARTIDRLGNALERKDSRELMRDVQKIAREHPTGFLAACASIGFAAARVMRSGAHSSQNQQQAQPQLPVTGGGISSSPYSATSIRMRSTSEHYAESLSGGPVR